MRIHVKYKLEKEMCDELIVQAKNNNWIVYPEQGGWDILLIRNNIQVGIQAKLRPNIKLLSQSFPLTERETGPHYRAIAVGNSNWKEKKDLIKLCIALRLI